MGLLGIVGLGVALGLVAGRRKVLQRWSYSGGAGRRSWGCGGGERRM